MNFLRPMRRTLGALILSAGLTACGDDDGGPTDTGTTDTGTGNDTGTDTGTPPTDAGNVLESATAMEAAATYSNVVHASYVDSTAQVTAMKAAITAFLDDPTEPNLAAARTAWIDARPSYLQTEVYRFYDGPIDGDDGNPEGLINAWPLDEFTVDYVDGMPMAGRINDLDFEITAERLADPDMGGNGAGGEADVATGWHAIEFLLWGQDLTEPAMNMPGQRPATDYTTLDNFERRALYLRTVTDQLESLMNGLVGEWAPDTAGNFRAGFDAQTPAERLQAAITGMFILSGFETGGERLQAALDAQDQEEEHSCFSDNTHNDMIFDIVGVQNVWLGRYEAEDGTMTTGTSIEAVVRAANPTLADNLTAQIQTSLDLANALVPPFDLEISAGNTEGNARVDALIESLLDQRDLLEEIFVGFGFTVPPEE